MFAPYDPLVTAGSWVHTELGGIDYGYLARRLILMGQTSRGTAMAAAIPDFSRQFEVYGLLFQATGQAERAPESFLNALRADPLNMQVRYAAVLEWIVALSRGEAPDDIAEIAAALEGAPAAVVEGLAHEAAEDWAALAALEGELAASFPTDVWFREVVRLRAGWRVNMAEAPEADDAQRLAAEAMALIEQVLILAVDENFHNLRARSARILGDAGRLVESSAFLATATNGYLTASAEQDARLSPEQLEQVRGNLEAISDNLGAIQDAPDPLRLEAVLENVNGLIRYVDEYPQE